FAIDEHEVIAAVWFLFEVNVHQPDQATKGQSHVGGLGVEPQRGGGCNGQHQARPRLRRSSMPLPSASTICQLSWGTGVAAGGEGNAVGNWMKGAVSRPPAIATGGTADNLRRQW